MKKIRSGLRKETPQNLMIGPGTAHIGVDMNTFDPMDESTWGRMLGATKDGNNVLLETEYYDPEMDGTIGPINGARRLVEAVAKVETTLLEMTKENFLMKLPSYTISQHSEAYDIFEHNGEIATTETQNLLIVGEIAGSRLPVFIILLNAQASNPFELTMGDIDSDVELSVEFEGLYEAEDPTRIPLIIMYPRGTSPVDRIEATPPPGSYGEPIEVKLSTKTPGAKIYYTTDGSYPTPSSPNTEEYTGAIHLDATTTIKAIAHKDAAVSDLANLQYIID